MTGYLWGMKPVWRDKVRNVIYSYVPEDKEGGGDSFTLEKGNRAEVWCLRLVWVRWFTAAQNRRQCDFSGDTELNVKLD